MSNYFFFFTDIVISNAINLNFGQCQTVTPLTLSKNSWKDAGYSFLLNHDIVSIDDTNSSSIISTPGWHVFIHDEKISFSETHMQMSGRVEYMFLEVNEEVEVKLTAQHFATIPSTTNLCEEEGQVTKCEETCVWDEIKSVSNCSAPWIPNIGLPYCDDYKSYAKLTTSYQR